MLDSLCDDLYISRIYLHFISFLHTDMPQVIGIMLFGKQKQGISILHSQLVKTMAAFDPVTDLIWRGLPRRWGDHHYLSSSGLDSLRPVFFFHAPHCSLEAMTTDRIKLSNHIIPIHRLHFILAVTVSVGIITALKHKTLYALSVELSFYTSYPNTEICQDGRNPHMRKLRTRLSPTHGWMRQ